MKTVLANGCFDLFHPGHAHILTEAKKLGTLVVAVNSDASATRIKRKPIHDINQRMESVRPYADFVVSFEEDTPERLIECLKPDIVVKGGDYNPADVISGAAEIVIIERIGGYSTTRLYEHITH